jgi:hypothetical protein
MFNSVTFVLVLEFLFMVLTLFILLRPHGIFGFGLEKKSPATILGGVFFLILTFLWSVITGIVLAMNDYYLHW